ncbi:MAG: prolipoprotein diacylglyceryl transferase [Planctomycetes bacterium]|nr:prolipoprotein diacylglyceryl transferase [Planctomycetota bacterium]
MHPVLIDLSQWRLFGLSLQSTPAKILAFAILVVAAMAMGSFLVRRRVRRRSRGRAGRWPGAVEILGGVLLVVLIVGLLWIVGRVHSYGLMLALGFLTAMGLARHLTRRCGEDPEIINNLAFLALAGGVLGARLSYVIEHWDREFGPHAGGIYRTVMGRLWEAIKLSSGGLVFDGGLILAVVLVLCYLLWHRLPVRRFLDILAVSAMIGLAFGRVGCMLNGCCFGGVCSERFVLGIHFPYAGEPIFYPHKGSHPYPPGSNPSPAYSHQSVRDARLEVPAELIRESLDDGRVLKMPDELQTEHQFAVARAGRSLAVHPAQLYGVINALVLATLLWAMLRLRSRDGQVFAMMFVFYAPARFILEFIRDDNPGMTLTPAQWKCLILFILGLVLLAALRRLPASCGPAFADRLSRTNRPDQQANPVGGRSKRHNRK